MKKKLTAKEKAFCKAYIIDFNATKAAEMAGYSKNTARQIGCQNLTKLNIQAEVNKELDKRIERVEVTQDRIIYELAKMAFVDISNYLEITTKGVKVKKNIDKFDMSVIGEASQTVTKEGGTIRIKLNDKLKALELLGRHLAMFTDKVDATVEANINLNFGNVNPKKSNNE